MKPTLALDTSRRRLVEDYARIRRTTDELCEPLEPEDMVVQTCPEVSPTKWHLAHVSWFFEAMVLEQHLRGYAVFDARFAGLFNSYYQSLGRPFPRPRRGLLSRPTVARVREYRRAVDEAMTRFLTECDEEPFAAAAPLVEVGLHHEQQHQELLLMDLKHVFAQNPLHPVYRPREPRPSSPVRPLGWTAFEGGRVAIGAGPEGFAYDNERPRHDTLIEAFELANRLVTAGEYQEFMADDGYRRPELWLSDGWDLVQSEGWNAPLYWEPGPNGWNATTLGGHGRVDPAEPVCHLSFYEADAYARWARCRLPSEAEWEHAAGQSGAPGERLESGRFHPGPAPDGEGLVQMRGDVWEWTASPYSPYPGYRRFDGSLSEYNGKFMINQVVLRGGCCVTPGDHLRASYRNFYHPHQRWMFSGLRLARSV